MSAVHNKYAPYGAQELPPSHLTGATGDQGVHTDDALTSNTTTMRDFLHAVFGGVEAGWLEIAYGVQGPNRAQCFSLAGNSRDETTRGVPRRICDALDTAATFAAKRNQIPNTNVYVGMSVRAQGRGRGKDADALATPAVWADFDAPGAARLAYLRARVTNLAPSLVVVTGRRPHTRCHFYWLLMHPGTPSDVCAVVARIATELGGDPTIKNPTRVMRIPGSIAWPKKTGRVREQTELAVYAPNRRYQLADFEVLAPALSTRPRADVSASAVGDQPRYVAAAVAREVHAVSEAPSGTRNHTANRAAFSLGTLVGAGVADEEGVINALQQAATNAGLPITEARRSILSGLRAGKKRPRELPRQEHGVTPTHRDAAGHPQCSDETWSNACATQQTDDREHEI